MFKTWKYMTICLVLAFVSSIACADHVTGHIEKLNLHSSNWSTYDVNDRAMVSIYVSGLEPGCGSTSTSTGRVIITTDHPLFNAVYSTLLAAKISGKKVRIDYLDTCTFRGDGWDFGYKSLTE